MKQRIAAISILVITIILTSFVGMPSAEAVDKPEYFTEVAYYETPEYIEAKQEEQEEAERLRASIEAYQERQQLEAERLFKEAEPAFTEDTETFPFYEIPEEFGGSLPYDVQEHIYWLCADYGVEYSLILGIIEVETGYHKDLIGSAGDTGYMQVVRKYNTERIEKLGVTDLLDPYQNVEVGIDLIAELLDKYDGNYAKALTAYNAGPQGAYENYFSAGADASPYAKKVLTAAERIENELGF